MSKQKFSLSVAPTFKAKVKIPVPGAADAPVEFTFKHKTRDQLKAFIEGLQDKQEDADDAEVVLDIASGWDLEDAFDEKGVNTLLQNYLGSAKAIIDTYIGSLTSGKSGN